MSTETKHTPTPWETSELTDDRWQIYRVLDENRNIYVADAFGRNTDEINANALRIVACINACEGISNSALDSGAVKELIEAAKLFRDSLTPREVERATDAVCAALAKLEGK